MVLANYSQSSSLKMFVDIIYTIKMTYAQNIEFYVWQNVASRIDIRFHTEVGPINLSQCFLLYVSSLSSWMKLSVYLRVYFTFQHPYLLLLSSILTECFFNCKRENSFTRSSEKLSPISQIEKTISTCGNMESFSLWLRVLYET